MKEHLIVYCYLKLKKKDVAIVSFVELLIIEDSTGVNVYLAKKIHWKDNNGIQWNLSNLILHKIITSVN
jgi:hypothetical protein